MSEQIDYVTLADRAIADNHEHAIAYAAIAQAKAAERQAEVLEEIVRILMSVTGSAWTGEGYETALMVATPKA